MRKTQATQMKMILCLNLNNVSNKENVNSKIHPITECKYIDAIYTYIYTYVYIYTLFLRNVD